MVTTKQVRLSLKISPINLMGRSSVLLVRKTSAHLPASGGPEAMDKDRKKSHDPNARALCSSRTAFNSSTLATDDWAPSKKPNVMKYNSKLGNVFAKGQSKVEIPVTERQTW